MNNNTTDPVREEAKPSRSLENVQCRVRSRQEADVPM